MLYLDVDTTGPRIFFLLSAGMAILMPVCALVFVFMTSNDWLLTHVRTLPRFSVHWRDNLVRTLFGTLIFSILAASFALLAQNVPGSCNWGYKVAAGFFSLSYYCVNLFLLAKLRAVESGLRAPWYAKFMKMVSLSTLLGMPCFGVVLIYTLAGVPVTGREGVYFCKHSSPAFVSIIFIVLQCFASVAYLILFVMPLVSTEKQVVAARTQSTHTHILHPSASFRGREHSRVSFRAVILRNFLSCIGSVGTTFVCMTILTITTTIQNPVFSMWAVSLTYIDLSINIVSILYALHPAWKRDRDDNLHASTRRDKDLALTSKSMTDSGSGSFPSPQPRFSAPPPASPSLEQRHLNSSKPTTDIPSDTSNENEHVGSDSPSSDKNHDSAAGVIANGASEAVVSEVGVSVC